MTTLYISGPDICGPGTKKVHVIFTYKGKNHLTKKEIRCKVCKFSVTNVTCVLPVVLPSKVCKFSVTNVTCVLPVLLPSKHDRQGWYIDTIIIVIT